MESKFIQSTIESGQVEMEEIEKVAEENFKTWADSLLTKDPQKVADLYAEDATFLPTLSPDFKLGKSETKEYFEHFLLKNPEGEIKSEVVQDLGRFCYLHSGLYDFEVNGLDGKRNPVEARFSFVWRKDSDGKWRIIHHHSSVRPKLNH